jgi:hypothetical protein
LRDCAVLDGRNHGCDKRQAETGKGDDRGEAAEVEIATEPAGLEPDDEKICGHGLALPGLVLLDQYVGAMD